ncbi:MAG: galactose-1-phosphate uridylyltransferase, partial [Candidatus Riflebacteria bacterium]|nr:galactose-1-phosphate uridylyltransferase [Candidatus Riflebacteria bacterium]
MPQLRKDPVTKRWVIILHEQAKTPADFQVPQTPRQNIKCPFCSGNESMTTPEVMSYRAPETL